MRSIKFYLEFPKGTDLETVSRVMKHHDAYFEQQAAIDDAVVLVGWSDYNYLSS